MDEKTKVATFSPWGGIGPTLSDFPEWRADFSTKALPRVGTPDIQATEKHAQSFPTSLPRLFLPE